MLGLQLINVSKRGPREDGLNSKRNLHSICPEYKSRLQYAFLGYGYSLLGRVGKK